MGRELNEKLNGKVSSGSAAKLGAIELISGTPWIDFHYGNSANDYTSRIIEYAEGKLVLQADLFNVQALLRMNGQNVATEAYVDNKFSAFTKVDIPYNTDIVKSGYLYMHRLGALCIVTIGINVTANASSGGHLLASGLPASGSTFVSAAFGKYTGKSYDVWINGTELLLHIFESLNGVDLRGQLVYFTNA